MVRSNRLVFRLFIALFTLAGMTLLTHSIAKVTRAAMRQANQPADSDLMPSYLPLVRRSGTSVCGKITSDTTWTALGNPYRVTCDVSVASDVTLTITAGVTVQFVHIEDDVIISGTLQAEGMPDAPISFQPASGATPGSWGQVAFLAGSSGVLDHTILEYGGSSQGLVYIASDAVQVTNSVVRHSADTGIVIQAASPLISATQLITNTGSYGGGLYNDAGSPNIENNTFSGNSALGGGYRSDGMGGGLYIDSGSPTIQNNTFRGNWATGDIMHGCWGNGGGLYNHTGNPNIQNNTFTGNSAGYGGGLSNGDGNPTIENNFFTLNSSIYSGAGLLTWGNSPIIQNNTFTNNTGGSGGGLVIYSGSPIIQNNSFTDNTADDGGGVVTYTGNPTIQNNTFIGNSAKFVGGGLYIQSDNPTIQNNTFINNKSTLIANGGGLYILNGAPFIRSNIVISSTGGGIYNDSGTPTLDYNDVWNNLDGDYIGLVPGAHDISADPLLVDPANGDIHLTAGSPCIDAGDPVNYPPTDFEGDPRPVGPAPDIGADEFLSGGLYRSGDLYRLWDAFAFNIKNYRPALARGWANFFNRPEYDKQGLYRMDMKLACWLKA